MKVKPKIGIGNLVFGTSKNEIIKILGKPNEIIIDPDDAELKMLVYNELEIKLTFRESRKNRLQYIRTSNSKLTYNGYKIINSEIEFVKNNIFGKLISKWEIENYEFFKVYFDEKYWISLEVDYGKVTNFEIGVPFNNENEYEWPNEKTS